ncbi:hypothetical protein J2S09_004100 [Bacillus fengqiuensis]|nr:hypothetical protein [Bacillus fengqiuensis]
MKIEISAEKLAAAVNKILIPAVIRKIAQEQKESKEASTAD